MADLVLLHTCEVPGLVAVAHAGRLAVQELGTRGPGGRTVLGAVQQVLAELQVGLGHLAGVLVTTGPGSFTGIRVGIATAQGLAAARGWRVHVCDSLVLEAMACLAEDGPVAVCHDARRGEVYVGLYDVSGALPVPLVAPFCAAPEEARARLRTGSPEGGVCVGTGAVLVAPGFVAWRERAGVGAVQRARAALALAARGGCTVVDAAQLEPFYLRSPDLGPVRRSP